MIDRKIDLNEGWFFSPEWDSSMAAPKVDLSEMEKVSLPHTVAVTPFHYFDESIYQTVSAYLRILSVPSDWRGKRILLTVDGAAHDATLYVNGKETARHLCGYTAFTVDLTDALCIPSEGTADNLLSIRLDSRESLNIPPFGNVIDYMTCGGLTREVFLRIKEPCYIEDVFSMTPGAGDPSRPTCICSRITVACPTRLRSRTASASAKEASPPRFEIRQTLASLDGAAVKTVSEKVLPDETGLVETKFDAGDVTLWDPDHPVLYTLQTVLLSDGTPCDEVSQTLGFREIDFRSDGFCLNGKRIFLRGLNRHQSFPYVGYAMPERLQREDADILKYELGLNAVRTSHYPNSQYFLDECDRIGLLVFTELPGWQYIGDDDWKKTAIQNLREMILQDRQHASIFLWGVRINESQDDDPFYERTNAEAHALDPTRPTGGVRFLRKSHLLEDVYTYNDFLHNGTNAGCSPKKAVTPDMKKGYLISEYNGHMYPTKPFDSEAHRTEQVKRHLTVLNAAASEKEIAGAFGWCFFDYNTHREFGAGDRVCYHGVCDMFRNPKEAASVYASQSDLRPVFTLTSTMDGGEHPGGRIPAVFALTNADSVRLYKNEEFVKEFYPDRRTYGALAHPPVLIDDTIGVLMSRHEGYAEKKSEEIKKVLYAIAEYGQNGLPLRYLFKMLGLLIFRHMSVKDGIRLYSEYVGNWGDRTTVWRFEAVRNGKSAETIIKTPSVTHALEITVGCAGSPETENSAVAAGISRAKDKTGSGSADVHILRPGSTYDAESIRIRMLDEHHNLLPYDGECIHFACSGAIALIGPDCISLKGGMGGTYVKTVGRAGEGVLSITCEGHTDRIRFLTKPAVHPSHNQAEV